MLDQSSLRQYEMYLKQFLLGIAFKYKQNSKINFMSKKTNRQRHVKLKLTKPA